MKTTKELARELGLLRRHRITPTVNSKRPRGVCQPFSYLIVLDFESTCWQDKKFRTQEIIEFPAVLLNTSNGLIESEFQFYVQPEEQPILSDFCRELTGITQDQVDDGIPLRLCLRKFSHWLDKLQKDKGINFVTHRQQIEAGSRKATLVTWSAKLKFEMLDQERLHVLNSHMDSSDDSSSEFEGFLADDVSPATNCCELILYPWRTHQHPTLKFLGKVVSKMPGADVNARGTALTHGNLADWDLGVCLFNEVRRKQLLKPSALNSWIDLRATYRKFYNRRPNGLNGALQDLGITFEGREHSGLHDARNTANLAWRMICDGCVLTTTKTIQGTTKDKAVLPQHLAATVKQGSPSKSPYHKRRKTSKDATGDKDDPQNNDMHSPMSRKQTSSKDNHSPMSRKQTCSKRNQSTKQSESSDRSSRIPIVTPSPPKHARHLLLTTTNHSRHKCQPSIANMIYHDPVTEQGSHAFVKGFSPHGDVSGSGLQQRDSNALIQTKIMPKKTNIAKKVLTSAINTSNTTSVQSSSILKTPVSSSILPKTQKTISSFKTPSPLGNSTIGIASSKVNAGGSFNQSAFRTPTNIPNSCICSEMKGTPPLCKCGKRAKRRIVQSPGPNLGKFFFSCASGSQHGSKGCGFFKWETSMNISNSGISLRRPFKQVCPPGTSQRRNLGMRPAITRQHIR